MALVATSFASFYATCRVKTDAIFWALSCFVLVPLTVNRTASFLRCPTEANSTYGLYELGKPDLLYGFPCDQSFVRQVAWSVARMPALLVLLSWQYGTSSLLVFFLIGITFLAATRFAPAWFQSGGRTFLVGLARFAPRFVTALELVCRSQNVPAKMISRIFSNGSNGWAIMACTAVVLPVPLCPHLFIATLEWLTVVAISAIQTGSADPSIVIGFAIKSLLLGVFLPSTVTALFEKRYRTTHHQILSSQAASVTPSIPKKQLPDFKLPAVPNPLPCPSRLPTNATDPQGYPPDSNTNAKPQNVCAAAAAAAAPGGAAPPAAAQQQHTARPGRALYKSRMDVRVVSVKVHMHDAYQLRNEIVPAVEACLADHFSSSGPTAGPQAPAYPSFLPSVSTTAFPGCLQLLVSIYQPLAGCPNPLRAQQRSDHADPRPKPLPLLPLRSLRRSKAHLASAPPTLPSSLRPLQTASLKLADTALLRRRVLAALPASCRDSPLTVDQIHLTGVAAPGAAVTGSAGLWPRLRMALQPVCVEACLAVRQEVYVQVEGVPGRVEGAAHIRNEVDALVVVQFWRRGVQEVVRKHQLLVLGGGAADGENDFRLHLPAHLDAAPVTIHLLAACPSQAGTLISSTTSMALPAAAASELLPSAATFYSTCAPNPADILTDMAAAWSLLKRPTPLPSLAKPHEAPDYLTPMLNALSTEGLPACRHYLQRLPPGPHHVPPAHSATPTRPVTTPTSPAPLPSTQIPLLSAACGPLPRPLPPAAQALQKQHLLSLRLPACSPASRAVATWQASTATRMTPHGTDSLACAH